MKASNRALQDISAKTLGTRHRHKVDFAEKLGGGELLEFTKKGPHEC